jgi:hypothetical protein
MNSWKLERDRLVATTMSFVEGVSTVGAAPNELSALPGKANDQRPAAEVKAASEPVGFIAGTGFETSMRDERDEIIRRVTAFRDLQIRIGQERRQYCDAVLAQTRAALGQGPKLGR